jgi:hypothetical protein
MNQKIDAALFIDNDVNMTNQVKECGNSMDVIHVPNAISGETLKQIRSWVAQKKQEGKKQLGIFIDYDGTLLKTEGSIFEEFNMSDPSVFWQKYMGGEARVKSLQTLFRDLKNQEVLLFVLTNNTGCDDPKTKEKFKEIIQGIFQVDVEILCGSKHNFHKRITLQKNGFQSICPTQQRGGHRRKTRRQRKGKKTRKH